MSVFLSFFQEVKKFFLHLPELCSVSVKLLASLDDCMEMAGVVGGGAQSPQAGFVFEEMAEVDLFSVLLWMSTMQYSILVSGI